MQFSLIVVMQEKVCEDSIARTMRLLRAVVYAVLFNLFLLLSGKGL